MQGYPLDLDDPSTFVMRIKYARPLENPGRAGVGGSHPGVGGGAGPYGGGGGRGGGPGGRGGGRGGGAPGEQPYYGGGGGRGGYLGGRGGGDLPGGWGYAGYGGWPAVGPVSGSGMFRAISIDEVGQSLCEQCLCMPMC